MRIKLNRKGRVSLPIIFTAIALLCTVAFAQQKGTFTDMRDKKAYKTVKIDEQTWMAENLNYNAKGSKCYDNKDANCKKYGRLYSLATAKTACPSGWHLPTKEEWIALPNKEDYLYKDFKAKSGWKDDINIETGGKVSGNGTDKFGFAALPGGLYCDPGSGEDSFAFSGGIGAWSSATSGYNHMISSGHAAQKGTDYLNCEEETGLFSIRCIKD